MRLFSRIVLVVAVTTIARGAQLDATLSPEKANIGDKLTLDMKVQGASPSSVQFPLPEAEQFSLLGIDSSSVRTEARLQYFFAVYDTGTFFLPEMPVIVGERATPETLYTPELGVTILPVSPDTASVILPLKPYREHPFRWKDFWRAVKSSPITWVGIGLAVLIAAWWIWRRYFRRQAEQLAAPKVLLSPHEQAVRDLIALKDKRYPSRGMLKEFFSEYTQIMRTYVERRYEFPALEMTTFDLERELGEERFPQDLSTKLLPTFHEADLVKFAKYIPPVDSSDKTLEIGFEIVAMTKLEETASEEVKAA